MLPEPTSLCFMTELRFLPLDEHRFDKAFVKKLYFELSKPGGYAYENLDLQADPPQLLTTRVTHTGTGRSLCRVKADRILIEESEPEVDVDDFIVIVRDIAKAALAVKEDCPPIFAQRCVIQCVAKPQHSKNSIGLLAGEVANVLDKIEAFRRPPQFFGVRFRFPPAQISTDNDDTDVADVEEKDDFVTVRFETWGKDVSQVWMETDGLTFFSQPIHLTDSEMIGETLTKAYSFLSGECIGFLNQFDNPPNSLGGG